MPRWPLSGGVCVCVCVTRGVAHAACWVQDASDLAADQGQGRWRMLGAGCSPTLPVISFSCGLLRCTLGWISRRRSSGSLWLACLSLCHPVQRPLLLVLTLHRRRARAVSCVPPCCGCLRPCQPCTLSVSAAGLPLRGPQTGVLRLGPTQPGCHQRPGAAPSLGTACSSSRRSSRLKPVQGCRRRGCCCPAAC